MVTNISIGQQGRETHDLFVEDAMGLLIRKSTTSRFRHKIGREVKMQ
jgi:hypothetical protein